MTIFSRRQFAALLGGGAAVSAQQPAVADRKRSGTRLILLGTGGGPRPRKTRRSSAQVILVGGAAYVVDCGSGVATQLVLANVPLPSLRHVFLTHHHSDHNADYGNLLLLAWESGLKTRVDAWGPPPLRNMTRLFLEMNQYDINMRIADEGRPPFAPLIHMHEFSKAGVVLQDEHVTVRCALVDHAPIKPAFAYRFDTADRSIVISGDTKYTDALVQLAKGADVLVHEVMFPSAIERLVAPLPNAAELKRSILSHHTAVEDAGRAAQAAGVKTLVLSHFVPAEDPGITEEMWVRAAQSTFDGKVIAGRDLMEV